MKRAAGFGSGSGWVLQPTPTGVSKDNAEEVFGAEIPEEPWREICAAFSRHGERLDKLEGTMENNNPNDARGWGKRSRDAERGGCANLNNWDKWIFRATGARCCKRGEDHDKTTAPESQPGIQSKSGRGCDQGREDAD
jgi:hypothetical protein